MAPLSPVPQDEHRGLVIFERLSQIKKIPTLPQAVERLREALADPDADLRRVAQIVESDPAISTGVLKVVNSALYRSPAGKAIADIRTALARLGTDAVKNIVLGTAVFGVFPKQKTSGFPRQKFWRHSIGVAVIGTVLAPHVRRETGLATASRELIHLCGLVHDIGKLILEVEFASEFATALSAAEQRQIPLWQAEAEVLGTDHAQIGGWLCDRWRLPDVVAASVRFHHTPDRAPKGTAGACCKLVHVADALAIRRAIGRSGSPVAPLDTSVLAELGLDPEALDGWLDLAEQELKRSDVLLSLA